MNKRMWCPDVPGSEKDRYVAFRGKIETDCEAAIEIRLLGASWFNVWLDGEYIAEGPLRYPADHPQYQAISIKLMPGSHVIAAQVHSIGECTRLLDNIPPYFSCEIWAEDIEQYADWKCLLLDAYTPEVRRINPELGWIEWCDTSLIPENWQSIGFDDSGWVKPSNAEVSISDSISQTIGSVKRISHSFGPIAQGLLCEMYGYELDNPSARFFLRDLNVDMSMAQGVWRRYDLGRVRLSRPRFVMDLPEGTIVEFAYCESLAHQRVQPWINLSCGDSCNLDHYIARGGRQEFMPITPKGGRFVEVHVMLPMNLVDFNSIGFINEEFVERCYFGENEGSFECSDPLLNKIWLTGIETQKACSEDGLVDNPTRERGQWAGDVASVGLDVASVCFSDLRLFKRALIQFAQCAREDGLVSGLCPGTECMIPTFSAQWVSACVHYWELTGDIELLQELLPYAKKNMSVFQKYFTEEGVSNCDAWEFMDWGYVADTGPIDTGANMHYLQAFRSAAKWCLALGDIEQAGLYQIVSGKLEVIIRRRVDSFKNASGIDWEAIGYHKTALGLHLGLIDNEHKGDAVEEIKCHILRCFPNDISAPKLSCPSANNSQLITPYFAHFAFPILIEHGEMDFVLDQYRKCWGWALEMGVTTWPEVFDLRWSHCHQWSGCPTWQLTKYILGLSPCFDQGQHHYSLKVIPGSISEAKGAIPMQGCDELITINWQRKQADTIHYELTTQSPIYLHIYSCDGPSVVQINGKFALDISV